VLCALGTSRALARRPTATIRCPKKWKKPAARSTQGRPSRRPSTRRNCLVGSRCTAWAARRSIFASTGCSSEYSVGVLRMGSCHVLLSATSPPPGTLPLWKSLEGPHGLGPCVLYREWTLGTEGRRLAAHWPLHWRRRPTRMRLIKTLSKTKILPRLLLLSLWPSCTSTHAASSLSSIAARLWEPSQRLPIEHARIQALATCGPS